MADRYYARDVRASFELLKEEAVRNGFSDAPTWELREASRANGRPWRLFGEGQSSLPFTSGNGFLGATAKQATIVLDCYRAGMYAVRDRQAWVADNA
jgi:hypothetical protein